MTPDTPLEIELKLALPPAQAPAFLKRMRRHRAPPTQQDLVTLYFDTPDFALSARGVALRVRRVGRRWVQTLKTEGERQGGLSRRVEFEMPVRRGALDWTRFPPEALAWVPAALRDAVVPVFETRFQRTAWLLKRSGQAIEVALDVGEVRAGRRREPLCEIELELKAGAPDALFERALAWAAAFDCIPFDTSKAERGVRLAHGEVGAPVRALAVPLAPGVNVEDGFAATAQACLAQFQPNLPVVLQGGADLDDAEYVHQARVALRRLRVAVRIFRRACPLPRDLAVRLRAMAQALGTARDWDVLATQLLPALVARTGPRAAAWGTVAMAVDAQRRKAHAAMRTALAQARPGEWLLLMQRWLLQLGWRGESGPRDVQTSALDAWARRVLERGHRRIGRGARAFAALDSAKRHRLRIALKRQRYAAEFFAQLFPGRAHARYLDVLRRAQESLGQANDAGMARRLLDTDARPELAFAADGLLKYERKAAQAAGRHLDAFLALQPHW